MPYYIATADYAWVLKAKDADTARWRAVADLRDLAGGYVEVEEITREQAIEYSHGRIAEEEEEEE